MIDDSTSALQIYYDKLIAMQKMIADANILKALREKNRQGTNDLANLAEDDLTYLIRDVKALLDSSDLANDPMLGEVMKSAIAFQSKVNKSHTLLVQLQHSPSYAWVRDNTKGKEDSLNQFISLLNLPGQLQDIPEINQLPEAQKMIASRQEKYGKTYSLKLDEIVSTENSMQKALEKLHTLEEELNLRKLLMKNNCPHLAALTELCISLARDSKEMVSLLELANTDPSVYELATTQTHITAYFKRLAQAASLYELAQPEYMANTQKSKKFSDQLARVGTVMPADELLKPGDNLLKLVSQPMQRVMRYSGLFAELLENAPNDPATLNVLKKQATRFAELAAYANTNRTMALPENITPKAISNDTDTVIAHIRSKIEVGTAIQMSESDIKDIKNSLSRNKRRAMRPLSIPADVYPDAQSLAVNYQLATQLGFDVRISPVNKTQIPHDLRGLASITVSDSGASTSWENTKPQRRHPEPAWKSKTSTPMMSAARSTSHDEREAASSSMTSDLTQAQGEFIPPKGPPPPVPPRRRPVTPLTTEGKPVPPALPTTPPPAPFQGRKPVKIAADREETKTSSTTNSGSDAQRRPPLVRRQAALNLNPSKPDSSTPKQKTTWSHPTKPAGQRDAPLAGTGRTKNEVEEDPGAKIKPKHPKG